MAETHTPREQAGEERAPMTAGTLQPKPITTRASSRPVMPNGRSHGFMPFVRRSSRPLSLYAPISSAWSTTTGVAHTSSNGPIVTKP